MRPQRVAKKTSKKDKERNITVAKWLFAQTTHVVRSKYRLAWWWSSGNSKSFKFHQHRLSGYQAVQGQNLAHLIT